MNTNETSIISRKSERYCNDHDSIIWSLAGDEHERKYAACCSKKTFKRIYELENILSDVCIVKANKLDKIANLFICRFY